MSVVFFFTLLERNKKTCTHESLIKTPNVAAQRLSLTSQAGSVLERVFHSKSELKGFMVLFMCVRPIQRLRELSFKQNNLFYVALH